MCCLAANAEQTRRAMEAAEQERLRKAEERAAAEAAAEANKPWWERAGGWINQNIIAPVVDFVSPVVKPVTDFLAGAAYQIVMNNIDSLAILNPFPGRDKYFSSRQDLDRMMPDSTAFEAGRLLGDVFGMVQGVWEMASGIATASGGTIVSCGTVVFCISGGAASVAVGSVVAGHGVLVTGVSAVDAGKRFSKISSMGKGDTGKLRKTISNLEDGKSPNVKVVNSSEELNSLYEELSRGGNKINWQNYDGDVVELPDGTQLGFRTASKTGGPTIDVVYPDGYNEKVHVK